MKRLPANSLFLVLLVQLLLGTLIWIAPQSFIDVTNIWLILCLSTVSLLLASLFGLRGAFLFLSPAITAGGIVMLFFPQIIPSWFLFACFVLLASLHLPALWTHVPYYPTPRETDQAILNLIPPNNNENEPIHFIDLGCGTGRLLLTLAKQRPDVQFYGVELSVLPYLIAKARSFLAPNLEVHFQSFWKLNLSTFDIIYAFLSPAPMPKLAEMIATQLKTTATFISNSFQLPQHSDLKEESVFITDEIKGGILFVYRCRVRTVETVTE